MIHHTLGVLSWTFSVLSLGIQTIGMINDCQFCPMVYKGTDTALSSSCFHNLQQQSLLIIIDVDGATVKVKGIKANPIPAENGWPLNALKLNDPLIMPVRSNLHIHNGIGKKYAIQKWKVPSTHYYSGSVLLDGKREIGRVGISEALKSKLVMKNFLVHSLVGRLAGAYSRLCNVLHGEFIPHALHPGDVKGRLDEIRL
jgi:hypothetical protein